MDPLPFSTMIYLGSLLAGWVLLPLIPAILIYWLFPNTAVAVEGPFASLTVKAGGAFAAYLVVFAALIPLVQTTKDTIGGFQRQFWTVKGQIKLLNADGLEFRSDDLIKKLRMRPPAFSVESYHATLKILEDDGQLPFPIIIEIPEFGEHVMTLKTAEATIDPYKKTIQLKAPILISPAPVLGSNRPISVSQSDRAHATETR